MKTLLILHIFVFPLFIINVKGQNNPCPNVFEYHCHENIKYGIITIPAPGEGKTIVSVGFGIYGQVYQKEGRLQLRKSLSDTVTDAKRGRNIQYILYFPHSEQCPIISNISLNYRTICRGEEIRNAYPGDYTHRFTYPSGSSQLSVTNRRSPGFSIPTPNNNAYPTYSDYPNYPTYPTYQERKPQPTRIPFEPQPTRIPYEPQPTRIPFEPRPTRIPFEPRPTRIPFEPRPTRIPYEPQPITIPFEPEPDQTQPPPTRPPNPARPISSSGPANPDDPAWLKTFRFASSCGKREHFSANLKPTELILGGVPVEIGEYPWMVAMYLVNRRKVKYACGATLVTDRHVITAAHCTKPQEVVKLLFGKHDLSKNEPSFVERITNNIVEHPEYVDNQAHGDIAIVTFDPIEFSNTIKPICIWPYRAFFDKAIRQGTITGWGQADREDDFSELPMQLNVTKTDITTCRNSHPQLRSLASDKTFCAGGESKGPCKGDSGSGFYIKHNNTFYLRGIISHSIAATIGGPCLLDNYAVYADIIYFLDWIREKIE